MASRVVVSGAEKSTVSANPGHSGRGGDGDDGGRGEQWEEGSRPGTLTKYQTLSGGSPGAVLHPAGFMFRDAGHARRNPTRRVSAPLHPSRMSCLNVYPLNKMCALWEQRAWGQACGELQERLGELVNGRRKEGGQKS